MLTVKSRFHGEKEQVSEISVSRVLFGKETSVYYVYQGDFVKLKFGTDGFVMERRGTVGFRLTVLKDGHGSLQITEGGVGGETPLITDRYETEGAFRVSFAYHYGNTGDDESQRESIELILKNSEEK